MSSSPTPFWRPDIHADRRPALLARGLSAQRPVVVLSDNSVDHLLLSYACQYVGVPIAPGLMPVEPLASGDAVRLVRTGDLPADTTSVAPVDAKVLRVTPGDTQTVVDVVVSADKAVQLAQWSGSGKIALVLDSRAR